MPRGSGGGGDGSGGGRSMLGVFLETAASGGTTACSHRGESVLEATCQLS